MKQFRKKPVIIEAMQFNDAESAAAILMAADGAISYNANHGESPGAVDEHLMISTLEGVMRADIGDYVIRGIKGEFYPCKPDIFAASYEEVL